MKKNQYVSPEVEFVQIVERCNILAGSGENVGGDKNEPGVLPPGVGGKEENSTSFFD